MILVSPGLRGGTTRGVGGGVEWQQIPMLDFIFLLLSVRFLTVHEKTLLKFDILHFGDINRIIQCESGTERSESMLIL